MDVKLIYRQLKKRYGSQGWWPLLLCQKSKIKNLKSLRIEHGVCYGIHYENFEQHRTPFCDPYFEIAVGAILTQNTAWKNVAVAIQNLYAAHALTPKKLLALHPRTLQKLIRPAGYFRQKAKKLRIFSEWLINNHSGDITELEQCSLLSVRCLLLNQWGIGPETADSILLYALNQPIFVIDEYTRRLCRAHGVAFKTYEEYRAFFEEHLKKVRNKSALFREYHALIVAWGKEQNKKG